MKRYTPIYTRTGPLVNNANRSPERTCGVGEQRVLRRSVVTNVALPH